MKIKVGIVQMKCKLGEIDFNTDLALEYVNAAADKGAKVVVLPELFSTGYRLGKRFPDYAETVPGPTTEKLCTKAKEKGIYIFSSIVEKYDENIYNTGILAHLDGKITKYRKAHLYNAEKEIFSSGDDPLTVVETSYGNLGLLICYDTSFPESCRTLALKGAQVFLVASASAKLYNWLIAIRSRALENGCFLVASNRIGDDGLFDQPEFFGHSCIVDPQGQIVSRLELGTGIAVAEIDLDYVSRQREEFTFLKDLRPELYMYDKLD